MRPLQRKDLKPGDYFRHSKVGQLYRVITQDDPRNTQGYPFPHEEITETGKAGKIMHCSGESVVIPEPLPAAFKVKPGDFFIYRCGPKGTAYRFLAVDDETAGKVTPHRKGTPVVVLRTGKIQYIRNISKFQTEAADRRPGVVGVIPNIGEVMVLSKSRIDRNKGPFTFPCIAAPDEVAENLSQKDPFSLLRIDPTYIWKVLK